MSRATARRAHRPRPDRPDATRTVADDALGDLAGDLTSSSPGAPTRGRRAAPRSGVRVLARWVQLPAVRRRPGPRHLAPVPEAAAAPAARALRLSPGPLGLLLAAVVLVVGSGAADGVRLTAGATRRPASGPAVPVAPVAQPAGLEALSPYLPQVSCNPVAMPGAVALGDLLRRTYPGTSYGIARACGSDGMASEHYEGRAVDWMASKRDPVKLAQVRTLLDWLLAPDDEGRPYANARRLGVMYLIWDDHIWGAYRAGEGWRPYSTCAKHPEPASDTVCHRDHVHISLTWAGAAGRTSFWTGRVAPVDYGPCAPADLNWAAPYRGPRSSPCPTHPTVTAPAGASPVVAALYRASGAQLGIGATGPLVTALQRGLGLTADGSFGPVTGARVSAFRTAHGLSAGQTADAATWRALLAAAGTGAGTTPTRPTTPTTPTSPTTPTAPTRPSPGPAPTPGSLAQYRGQLLGYDSAGPAVAAVQRLLGVTPTGWFGPRTLAAVRAFQSSHGIP
ncbi:MAG TPA: peptidoglycan-binding domain-containing protein, partial [Kineosporiaceae bacterium]|nr:peptidoglycan-binding domain-containing protein [Kineosporiaceae bacterium]